MSVSYFVRYEIEIADLPAFLRRYREVHVPLVARWPGLRRMVLHTPLACWAHGIVHLMEGDLPNARYWYGQAKRALPAEASAAAEIKALKGALGAEK